MSNETVLTLGHSPDSDDAFMFYPLSAGLVETGNLRYVHVIEDIESLNRRARKAELDVTAISVHAYAYISEHYALLSSGASVGDGYGPILVARKGATLESVRRGVIAIPGEWTSAFLALRLFLGRFRHQVVPFDQIMDAVSEGSVDAGLLIHEGQLTYEDLDLERLVDLGVWWRDQTKLVLPLGILAVKRSLGSALCKTVEKHLRRSFAYVLAHRDAGLRKAADFARGLRVEQIERFIEMYVNEWTLDLGERGKESVREFLRRGAKEGIIPTMPSVDFVEI